MITDIIFLLILKPIIISAVVLGIIYYSCRKYIKEEIEPILDRMIDKVSRTTNKPFDKPCKGRDIVTDENYTEIFDAIGDKLEANDFDTGCLTEEESEILSNYPCEWMIYHNEKYIAEERRKRAAHPELYEEGQEG